MSSGVIANFSLSRWYHKLFGVNSEESINSGGVAKTSNNINVPHNECINTTTTGSERPTSFECYACTQVGFPAFHPISCNQVPNQRKLASSPCPVEKRVDPADQPNVDNQAFLLGPIIDPRSSIVRGWNRAIMIARVIALATDPMFFYTLSIGLSGAPCLVLQHLALAIITAIRTCVDAVHLSHMLLQFRLAYVSRESLVVGSGKLVWDAHAIAWHYLRSLKYFWLDLLVILPIPQVLFWTLVPKLVREQRVTRLTTILLVTFLVQFVPKAYHSLSLMRRMRKATGYIFGTIWWGFFLSLLAYVLISHVVGGVWYMLGIERLGTCIAERGSAIAGCDLSLPCSSTACSTSGDCPDKITEKYEMCFNLDGGFNFGIYDQAVPAITSHTFAIKFLYPHCWAIYQFSSLGNNVTPTQQWSESLLCIFLTVVGMTLFTLMCGNIEIFLAAVMTNKSKLVLGFQRIEMWMRRRQLPNSARQRVRKFERQRWSTTGGADEMELMKHLPQGLRRDIKRYLYLDFIKEVPLFHYLDDLILDNICDRVKPLVYYKNEKIMREGDPVIQMVFIVHGRIQRSQCQSKGFQATSTLKPGGFFGDELLSWSLRRPFIHRLPAASATFICLEPTEAFGLEAHDLRYITEHFRYKFAKDSLKRKTRYYSANWRTWAAVSIQHAWRRYINRNNVVSSIQNGTARDDDDKSRLRQFAANFMSLRPHDHID